MFVYMLAADILKSFFGTLLFAVKLIILAVFLVLVAGIIIRSTANAQSQCAPSLSEALAAVADEKYKEAPYGYATTTNGARIVFTMSPETGKYSVFVENMRAPGVFCLVGWGEDFTFGDLPAEWLGMSKEDDKEPSSYEPGDPA